LGGRFIDSRLWAEFGRSLEVLRVILMAAVTAPSPLPFVVLSSPSSSLLPLLLLLLLLSPSPSPSPLSLMPSAGVDLEVLASASAASAAAVATDASTMRCTEDRRRGAAVDLDDILRTRPVVS